MPFCVLILCSYACTPDRTRNPGHCANGREVVSICVRGSFHYQYWQFLNCTSSATHKLETELELKPTWSVSTCTWFIQQLTINHNIFESSLVCVSCAHWHQACFSHTHHHRRTHQEKCKLISIEQAFSIPLTLGSDWAWKPRLWPSFRRLSGCPPDMARLHCFIAIEG